jgi:hypothetical protein
MGSNNLQTSQTQQTQQNLPSYLQQPYQNFVSAIGQQFMPNGQTVAPYTPYGGQMFADPSALTQQYWNFAQQLPNTTQAGLAGQAAAQQRDPNSANITQLPTQGNFNLNTPNWTDPGVSQSYMNPYLQNVLTQQQQLAQQQFQEQGLARNAQATQSGAYGGDRQAVADSLAARDLNQQLQSMQAQGLSNAYTTGLQGFQSDAMRQLEAGLGGGQLQLGQEQLGLTSQQAQQQAQQALQSGNLSALLGAGQLQGQQNQYNLAAAGALGQAGAQQGQYAQNPLDFQYQQWLQGMMYPMQELQQMGQMYGSIPAGMGSQTTIQQPNMTDIANVLAMLSKGTTGTG